MCVNYLYIETLFNNCDRTIENLVLLYDNIELLKEKIKILISNDIEFIDSIKNKRVLLKPNWVMHSINENDEICLRTNDKFLLVITEVILELKPQSITIADSPIQFCNWDKITHDLKEELNYLSEKYEISIFLKDLRRSVYDVSKNKIKTDIIPISKYVIFDLAKKSYLEKISKKNKFRVTNYNPDMLNNRHSLGLHKYCISKELFSNDVIILIPKIKTHQKSGITGAIKNLVGINGDKDYLPHHRVGGTDLGGDCYPGKSKLRRISEYFLDIANKNIGSNNFYLYKLFSVIFWRINKNSNYHKLSAGWYGNDTTWRMVSDINLIGNYGKEDGSLSESKIRTIYSISDGIIGGQGDGPLKPDPLPLGIISFSNNSVNNDAAMAKIMGFNINKIPLLYELLKNENINNCIINVNGNRINFEELDEYKINTIPPSGWMGYIN